MRYQQVSVDVWKMVVTAVSYLALAFAAWVLLRLVSACVSLPGYLRKQQQEEEEEEERRLLHELEDQDQDEDEDENEDDGGSDDKEAAEQKEEAPLVKPLEPATPKASRHHRRGILVGENGGQGQSGARKVEEVRKPEEKEEEKKGK